MGKHIKFDYVNENANFGAILQHYGEEYKVTGTQIRALCPFHDDTNPSLSISTQQTDKTKANTFHCFGCGEKGSAIDYVAFMESTDDLRDASQIVAEVSGCGLAPARRRQSRRTKKTKPSEARRERSSKNITNGEQEPLNGCEAQNLGGNDTSKINLPLEFSLKLESQHPYIDERNISPDLGEVFGIGFLSAKSRSMMSGRVCIPIENFKGELIAYAGRYPSDDVPDDIEKYLLPPKFAKQSALYNLHRIVETDCVIVVEGFFSTMRLHALHVPVVGLMGTSMAEEQVALLKQKGIERVVVMLDGDGAGKNATPALLSLLARSFFVTVVELPDDEAPDTIGDEVLYELAERFVRS